MRALTQPSVEPHRMGAPTPLYPHPMGAPPPPYPALALAAQSFSR